MISYIAVCKITAHRYASSGSGTGQGVTETASIMTGGQARERSTLGIPPPIQPMLPTPAPPFHRKGWIYEEKYDGWRIMAYKRGDTVRLLSRNGIDFTGRFRELAVAIAWCRTRSWLKVKRRNGDGARSANGAARDSVQFRVEPRHCMLRGEESEFPHSVAAFPPRGAYGPQGSTFTSG